MCLGYAAGWEGGQSLQDFPYSHRHASSSIVLRDDVTLTSRLLKWTIHCLADFNLSMAANDLHLLNKDHQGVTIPWCNQITQ